jgi:polyisoprenoid-binding protein YceI
MKFLSICIYLLYSLPFHGQYYMLSQSQVSFFSSAPVEDIEAHTSKARSLFNIQTGAVAFVIPTNTFRFNKKLMQEHLNENYLESHKYPDATFKGTITPFDPAKKGPQSVAARGQMNIHGITSQLP